MAWFMKDETSEPIPKQRQDHSKKTVPIHIKDASSLGEKIINVYLKSVIGLNRVLEGGNPTAKIHKFIRHKNSYTSDMELVMVVGEFYSTQGKFYSIDHGDGHKEIPEITAQRILASHKCDINCLEYRLVTENPQIETTNDASKLRSPLYDPTARAGDCSKLLSDRVKKLMANEEYSSILREFEPIRIIDNKNQKTIIISMTY